MTIFSMTDIEIDKSGLIWLIYRPGDVQPVVQIHFFHLYDAKEIIDSEDHMRAIAACVNILGFPSPEEVAMMKAVYPQLPSQIDPRCLKYIEESDWKKTDFIDGVPVVEGEGVKIDNGVYDVKAGSWDTDDEDEDDNEEVEGYTDFEPNEERVGRPKRRIVF